MYEFGCRTRIVVSDNLAEAALSVLAREKAARVAVMADENVASHPAVKGLMEALAKRGKASLHPVAAKEPTTDLVDAAAEPFRAAPPDFIIGVGGGSVLDLAKAVSVMAVLPGKTADYHGTGKAIDRGIRKMLAPTTAGTGSEVTPGAVLVNPATKFKRALGGDLVQADYAVLSAELTLSLPKRVTAASGMDALAHCIESYTAKCANDITRSLSRRAFSMVHNALPRVLRDGGDVEARRRMLVGSCLAGIAIYNSNTGACHAQAYPLGIYHDVPHGIAVGLLIPRVVEANVRKGCRLYADLLDEVDGADRGGSAEEKSRRFSDLLSAYPALAALERRFADYGIGAKEVPFLSERGLDLRSALDNNPVPFGREDFASILSALAAA